MRSSAAAWRSDPLSSISLRRRARPSPNLSCFPKITQTLSFGRIAPWRGAAGLQGRAMQPKLRVRVSPGKQLKFGDGRARLLELIDERGSLRQAAAELRMSYRNA